MSVRGALLVGAAVCYLGAQHNQGGTLFFVPGGLEGPVYGLGVMAVGHPHHMPFIGFEPLFHVLGKGEIRRTFDGYPVVIVKAGQPREGQVSGQGGRLRGHTFHHVPVAAHDIGIVTDDFAVGLVVDGGQVPFSHGHAHSVGESLAQRPGGGFHPWGEAELGMPRGFAVPLAEPFEVVQGKGIPGEVQQAVDQHGGMSAGKHETVAVEPGRVCRVVAHYAGPQHEGGRGQAHGCSRMSGVGLLYTVH